MIRYLLAYVLCFEGAFLTLPAMVGFYYGETKDALIYLGLAAVVHSCWFSHETLTSQLRCLECSVVWQENI